MKRAVALAALLVALLTLVPIADAQQPTLVVTGYGGRWSEVMKKALVEPFEKKHGVKVEVVTGITTEWVAKLLAAGPDNPPYDVVFGNEPAFPIPRERGFFDKRNEALAPNILRSPLGAAEGPQREDRERDGDSEEQGDTPDDAKAHQA